METMGGSLTGTVVPVTAVKSSAPISLNTLTVLSSIDSAMISGHSARVGMSQDLVGAGADLAAVMQAGRWKTPMMPARYSEHLLAAKGAVAQYYQRRGGV